MKKLFLILFTLSSFLFGDNMFVITNSDGTIAKKSKVKHTQNRYFDDLILEQERLLKQLKKIKSHHTSYDKDQILQNAKKHLGGKYVWGGTQPKGFDCSGYMKYLYEKEGIEIPRTAYAQSKVGLYVTRSELKKGDLLFFLTDKKRNIPITHVGMYIGDDKFIHAASKKKGIIISSLSKSKYNKIFVKAKRIIQ
jgi:cell wall-associated NlpC family hydrolase